MKASSCWWCSSSRCCSPASVATFLKRAEHRGLDHLAQPGAGRPGGGAGAGGHPRGRGAALRGPHCSRTQSPELVLRRQALDTLGPDFRDTADPEIAGRRASSSTIEDTGGTASTSTPCSSPGRSTGRLVTAKLRGRGLPHRGHAGEASSTTCEMDPGVKALYEPRELAQNLLDWVDADEDRRPGRPRGRLLPAAGPALLGARNLPLLLRGRAAADRGLRR